jgi:signal transduction histidine kinase
MDPLRIREGRPDDFRLYRQYGLPAPGDRLEEERGAKAMQNHLLLQARQNRLIATVRVFQASFSLASALVEHGEAGGFDPYVRRILVGYLGVSALGCVVAYFWRSRHETLFIGLLTVDALVFAAVLYLTAGSTSPFFAVFLLIVLSATLEWGWRGAAAATATALAVFAVTILPAYHDLTGFPFDPPRFILRVGTLLSIGGLLVAYGQHQERINEGMLSLFGTPLPAEASERPPILECLEFAASVFGLERAAFAWGDPEEPGLQIDQLTPDGQEKGSWPISSGDPLVEGPSEPFFFDGRSRVVVSLAPDGRTRRDEDRMLTNPLLGALAAELTLVLPVSASRFSGWIILSDFPSLDREALIIGGVVATQASVAIEAWRSLVAWRDAAAAEERVRIARDLHDGTLQFMAGTAMQLTSLFRELEPGQKGARERVQRLLEDLKSEQRQLRVLIDSTSASARLGNRPADFQVEVQNLAAVLARRWSTDISVNIEQPTGRELPGNLAFDLLQIVREAISNAVRHGKASAVSIAVDSDKNSMDLTISDNGVGMSVHGVFDMQELKAMRAGPRMLQDRVAGLGGELVLESGSNGTTLRIRAPLARAAS